MSSEPTPPVPTTSASTHSLDKAETARLHSLTGLRAILSIFVVFQHTLTPSITNQAIGRIPHTVDFFTTGLIGPMFFFALSGVVLTWTYTTALPKVAFYGRRFARIWPTHAFTTLLAIFVVFPILDRPSFGVTHNLSALFLVQSWVPNPSWFFAGNGPSWSLACEAFFYASLPFLLPWIVRMTTAQRKVLAGACVAAFVAVPFLVYEIGDGFTRMLALWVFPAYRATDFILGVMLGLALREGWRPRWKLWHAWTATGVLYVIAAIVCGHWFYHLRGTAKEAWGSFVPDFFLLGPALMVIASAAATDLAGKASTMAKPVMVWLGDRSFSLYLIHPLIVLLVASKLHSSDSHLDGLPVWVLTFGLCILGAHLTYRLVEHPFERIIRRWFNRFVPKSPAKP